MRNGRFILKDGSERWYKDNVFHREGGPAKIWKDGTEEWYQEGKLHREDGPAVIDWDGTKAWYICNQLHREDGPARIWGSGYKEWWLNGSQLKREEWWERISHEMKVKVLFNGEGL
jgi:hypothetical protein